MGKRIIQQRRGKGSPTYRVREQAFKIKFSYPEMQGAGIIEKLINSIGYSSPIAKIKANGKTYFNVATEGLCEGQTITIGNNAEIKSGNIIPLKSIPIGTEICNIELNCLGGGKIVRSGGSFATVTKKVGKYVGVLLPSKKEMMFDGDCRATIGRIAGAGRTEKPIVKAGNKYYAMRARSKHYPRTSPIKRNAVNHPFGGGRGKNMGKASIAPRFSPPGRKVGLLKAKHTGRNR